MLRLKLRGWYQTTWPSLSRISGPLRPGKIARGVTNMKPGAFPWSSIVTKIRGMRSPDTLCTDRVQRLSFFTAPVESTAPASDATTAHAPQIRRRLNSSVHRRGRGALRVGLAPDDLRRADDLALGVERLDLERRPA